MARPLSMVGVLHNAILDFQLQSLAINYCPSLLRAIKDKDDDTIVDYMERLIRDIYPPYNPFPPSYFIGRPFGSAMDEYAVDLGQSRAEVRELLMTGFRARDERDVSKYLDGKQAEILNSAIEHASKKRSFSEDDYDRYLRKCYESFDFEQFPVAQIGLGILHASVSYWVDELPEREWLRRAFGRKGARDFVDVMGAVDPWGADCSGGVSGALTGAGVGGPFGALGGGLLGGLGASLGASLYNDYRRWYDNWIFSDY